MFQTSFLIDMDNHDWIYNESYAIKIFANAKNYRFSLNTKFVFALFHPYWHAIKI